MYFTFSHTPTLLFGNGQFKKLTDQVKSFGNKVLIVSGSSFKHSAQAAEITKALQNSNIDYIFEQIHGEPTPGQIDKLTADNRGFAPEVVVAIGGGSVLDAGKAVSAMLCEEGSITDYLEGVGLKSPSGAKVPMIAVPTTSGTGSEATKNAVISKNGKDGFKKSLRHNNFVPNIAIVDPALTVSCPPSVTAASGMDAFTQLFESYLSTQSNPMTDALALEGLKRVIHSLEDAVYDGKNIEARTNLSYAAFLSGITLANAGLGVVHGFAQPLGSLYPIPHGVVCAILTGPANRVSVEKLRKENNQIVLEKYATAGRLVNHKFDDEKAIDGLLDYIEGLATSFKIPKLSSFAVTRSEYKTIIAQTGLKNHPVELNEDELAKILDACL
jgi:alcohol dehydrogenase class IV